MTASEEIVTLIDQRLREAGEEIESLDRARAALAAPEVAPPVRRARKRPARKRARTSTATTEVVPAGKLELLLSESGAATTAALAERANGDRGQVLTLLREMEAAGKVRRIGQRRSTRWHLITEEEWIQARAAELAARSEQAV